MQATSPKSPTSELSPIPESCAARGPGASEKPAAAAPDFSDPFTPTSENGSGNGDAASTVRHRARQTSINPPEYRPRRVYTRRSIEGIGTDTAPDRYPKPVKRLPFRRRLALTSDGCELKAEDRATEYLSLFYDLVFVAVLSTFTSTHDLRTPSGIPVFFSYYTVLVWIWTSQIHYDTRYEAEDFFHRTAKVFQIILFVYIGASGGGWDIGSIRRKPLDHATVGVGEARAVLADANSARAVESFTTVGIAFAVTRFILAVQYCFAIGPARAVGLPTLPPIASVASQLLSCSLAIVAVVIPASSAVRARVKPAMFYLGIAEEVIVWATLQMYTRGWTPVDEVTRRYGSFTLIILGEGFVALTIAFNRAIDGLNIRDYSVYGQVFLVILIMYHLWSFLFSNFRSTDAINPYRTLVWEFVHFPLHFALLLLMASLTNMIVATTFFDAIDMATEYFETIKNATLNHSHLSAKVVETMMVFLIRIEPGLGVDLDNVLEFVEKDNATSSVAEVMEMQLFGRMLKFTATKVNAKLSDNVSAELAVLQSLKPEDGTNHTVLNESVQLAGKALQGLADDAASGALWLFPIAGLTLILTAVRSMVRYRFTGKAGYLVHGLPILAGTVLALLGLLGIGNKELYLVASDASNFIHNAHVNPLYELFGVWAILIVAAIYTAVNLGSMAALGIVHYFRGDVFHSSDN
ncbi:hypothetical protein Q8F55_004554 [Vanrija albida]|uniref:Low temperature requirement protein A n=1 Tax=Vanrija albida TaxID=181172 RepID=A0ABR3Q7A8_9TREE